MIQGTQDIVYVKIESSLGFMASSSSLRDKSQYTYHCDSIRYGNAHNMQYGIPDAFTGNATAAVEHTTARMDYQWPTQIRHGEFQPLERAKPAQ